MPTAPAQDPPIQTPDVAAGRTREPAGGPVAAPTPEGGDPYQADREAFRKAFPTASRRSAPATEPGGDEPSAGSTDAADDAAAESTGTERDEAATDPQREAAGKRKAGAQASEGAELRLLAKRVFQRDGHSARAVEALLAVPDDELLESYERRVRAQRETDRLRPPGRGGEAPQAPAAEPDPIDELSEHFKAIGDEDGAAIVRRLKSSLRLAPQAPAQPSDQERYEQQSRFFRRPMEVLATNHPELKTEDGRRRVLRCAERLAQSGYWEGHEPTDVEIIRVAAGATFAQSAQQAQARMIERNRAERDGQPTPPSPTGPNPPPSALSGQDRDRAAFRMLRSGNTPVEVRRKLSSPVAR